MHLKMGRSIRAWRGNRTSTTKVGDEFTGKPELGADGQLAIPIEIEDSKVSAHEIADGKGLVPNTYVFEIEGDGMERQELPAS